MERAMLNRRELLRIGTATFGAAVLGGCGVEQGAQNESVNSLEVAEYNKGFSGVLEKHLGINDETTRSELGVLISKRDQDPSFLVDTPNIATFINSRGNKIILGTNEFGGSNITSDQALEVFEYDDDNSWVQDVTFGTKSFRMMGPRKMVEKYLMNDEVDDLYYFMDGLMGGVDTPFNSILNALPLQNDVILGDMTISFPDNYPNGVTFRGGEKEPFYGMILNLNMIHMQADKYGLDVEQGLRKTLVNEAVNLLGLIEADRRGLGTPKNEAPSTLAGFAAAFNPERWDKFFGGESFTKMIGKWSQDMEEMKRKS